MTDLFGVKIFIPPWVVLPLLLLATVILAYLISSVTLWVLRRSMPELSKESGNRLYRLFRSYFFPVLIVGGLLIVVDAVPLPPKVLRVADRVLVLSGLVLLIFVLGKASLLAHPEPSVRLIPGFGDFAMNFTLTCHVGKFFDQFLVQHEMRKRIINRFRKEGIQIPFH